MPDVLFLAHRLPYPPDKGDKVRSYHLLQQLRRHFDVHLGCFFDDPADRRHVAAVEDLVAGAKILQLQPLIARLKSSAALLRGEALSVPYFYDREMAEWVARTLRDRHIRHVVVYSSPMAQYVLRSDGTKRYRVMDFVDVDSDKWLQYSRRAPWPIRHLYAREGRLLAAYERAIAAEFDAVSFVTRNEVELFDGISAATRAKHHVVPNGVDADYFDPTLTCANPFSEQELPIVFTGMMSYRPNIDAARWFAQDIFPRILQAEPRAHLWVVGASPSREVRALHRNGKVSVTGRVADVRPYLKYARLAVAPLRIARGVQNKVLEAMSMGCPVICSGQAAAGLEGTVSAPVVVARSEEEFATESLRLLSRGRSPEVEGVARRYVIENYDWERNLRWFVRNGLDAEEAARERVEVSTSAS